MTNGVYHKYPNTQRERETGKQAEVRKRKMWKGSIVGREKKKKGKEGIGCLHL